MYGCSCLDITSSAVRSIGSERGYLAYIGPIDVQACERLVPHPSQPTQRFHKTSVTKISDFSYGSYDKSAHISQFLPQPPSSRISLAFCALLWDIHSFRTSLPQQTDSPAQRVQRRQNRYPNYLPTLHEVAMLGGGSQSLSGCSALGQSRAV